MSFVIADTVKKDLILIKENGKQDCGVMNIVKLKTAIGNVSQLPTWIMRDKQRYDLIKYNASKGTVFYKLNSTSSTIEGER